MRGGDFPVDGDLDGGRPTAPTAISIGLDRDSRHAVSSAAFPVEPGREYATTPRTPVPPLPSRSQDVVDSGVDTLSSLDTAELCERMDAIKKILVARFKAFLSETFAKDGVSEIGVDFERLEFSVVSVGNMRFVRIQDLSNPLLLVQGQSISLSDLCSTEGLKVTLKGDRFDLDVPIDLFDVSKKSVIPGSLGEPTRNIRVPVFSERNPDTVAGEVRDVATGVVPGDESVSPRVRDDSSLGFEPLEDK